MVQICPVLRAMKNNRYLNLMWSHLLIAFHFENAFVVTADLMCGCCIGPTTRLVWRIMVLFSHSCCRKYWCQDNSLYFKGLQWQIHSPLPVDKTYCPSRVNTPPGVISQVHICSDIDIHRMDIDNRKCTHCNTNVGSSPVVVKCT